MIYQDTLIQYLTHSFYFIFNYNPSEYVSNLIPWLLILNLTSSLKLDLTFSVLDLDLAAWMPVH